MSFNIVEVDGVEVEAGRLKVETQSLAPPTGFIGVKQTIDEEVQGNNSVSNTYLIPSGKTLRLSGLYLTCERALTSSKVTLYYAQNGVLDGTEIVIDKILLEADLGSVSLIDEFIGNGTNAIILVAKRMGSGEREVYTKWWGYYNV